MFDYQESFFDATGNTTFFYEMLKFFSLVSKINDISETQSNAYHILPGYERPPKKFMPSVIAKIEKLVYKTRKRISRKQSQKRGLMIYIKENLPALEANLRNEIATLG